METFDTQSDQELAKGTKRAASRHSKSGLPVKKHLPEEVKEGEDEGGAVDEDGEETAGEASDKKKKKKKRKRKPQVMETTPSLVTAEALSSYLWKRYVSLLSISPLDADANLFPPDCFALPVSSSMPSASTPGRKRKSRPLPRSQPAQPTAEGGANVTEFLQSAFPQLQMIATDKSQREKGMPFVVLLSSSAVRANELAKDLRIKLRNLKTAKLFAKHLKVPAQVEVLQSEFHALAVGTPNRLSKLLEMGALSLDRCRLVVLDTSFKDSKGFDLLHLPGLAADTALFLRDHVLKAMAARSSSEARDRLRLALF